ncbi:triadin isoform X2 [Dermochelys coriacea]|uniref:triadin isoform X2 n=1 Tax=Dermochelys coriacea TaxID=27794 RepID=UPI001CA7C14B|nr:triadin isoform X2 [Dermochelys coriacea]
MAEITTEGHMSTTTTVMDNKNGSVLTPPVKMGKKSVTEDLMTTFSSPAAWLLVVALIVTWSAVAIIMFDLVDYKTFAGSSVNKLSKEPLRIIHQTVEESTDWLYGFISLLSDIVSTDDDDSDEGEVEPPLKKKEIRKDKPDRQEKLEKPAPKVIHKEKPEKQEKIERKEQPKVKDKSERTEKPEKKEKLIVAHKTKPAKQETAEKAPPKVIQKDKPEREEKVEKKAPPKEEKKAKSTKVEEKVKKEVKDGKAESKTAEKGKQTEAKVEDTGLIKAKSKVKEEKAVKAETKSEKKGKQNQEESAEDPKRVVGKKQRQ